MVSSKNHPSDCTEHLNVKLQRLWGSDGPSAQRELLPAGLLMKQDCSPIWFPAPGLAEKAADKYFPHQVLAVAVKAELFPTCCCLASLPRDRWTPLSAAPGCHLPHALPLSGTVLLCCCGLCTRVEWKAPASLAQSTLSLPLQPGLITSLVPLYGRRAERMGNSHRLLEQLDLATAKPAHLQPSPTASERLKGTAAAGKPLPLPTAGYPLPSVGQHPECCRAAPAIRAGRARG